MLSLHFNKEVFTDTMKTKHIVTYLSTTLAIMIMLAIYGFIQGNLKPELFVYAFFMSIAFAIWNLVDHKCRKTEKYKALD